MDISNLTIEALEETMGLLEQMSNPNTDNALVDFASRFVRFTVAQEHRLATDPVMIRIYNLHIRMIRLTHKFPR
jgi:hypothetical protein